MDDVTTKAEDVLDAQRRTADLAVRADPPVQAARLRRSIANCSDCPDAVTVHIVPGAAYMPSRTRHLITELTARLGDDVRIEVDWWTGSNHHRTESSSGSSSHVPLGI